MLHRLMIAAGAVVALGGVALAADLPTTKGPAVYTPPPPVFTWTGFYVGGQAGYQWGSADGILLGPGSVFLAGVPDNPKGFVGGGHIGYNYQIDQFVLGVEGDVEGLTFRGTFVPGRNTPPPAPGAPVPIPPFAYVANSIPLQGSLRGRIGYAWDRVLIYGTGGLALADVHNAYGAAGVIDSFWSTRPGWTAGGGIDYAIDNNWSLGVEYRYTDYGHYYDALANTYPADFVRVRLFDNAVRGIFSYKFN